MNNLDKQYLDLLNHILQNGRVKGDRTGTGTKSVFGYTIRHNMSDGFPMLTSKKVYFKGVAEELLWFLKGSTNIQELAQKQVNIWNGDAYKNFCTKFDHKAYGWSSDGPMSREEFVKKIKSDDDFAKVWGELGPVYGSQWRDWGGKKFAFKMKDINGEEFPDQDDIKGVDQIQNLINDLRTDPDSRRLMVNAWNVSEIKNMVLPPCHYVFQCYTRELTWEERSALLDTTNGPWDSIARIGTEMDNQNIPKRAISLKFTMRSVDVPLGLPFNLASYGLLLLMLANEVNMLPEDLIFSGGDCHIYLNQIDGIKKQIEQETFDLPKVEISKKSIFDIQFEDIKLIGYKSSESIKIPLSN